MLEATWGLSQSAFLDGLHKSGFLLVQDIDPKKFQMIATKLEGSPLREGRLASKQGPSQQNEHIRNDTITWVDLQTPALKEFQDLLLQLKNIMNRDFFWSLREIEIQYAVYPSGGFYKKHLDQPRHSQDRKITFIYYLNSEWTLRDGGELVLYNPENPVQELQRILPQGGQWVFFQSERIPHEVLYTYRQRKSLTGWFRA